MTSGEKSRFLIVDGERRAVGAGRTTVGSGAACDVVLAGAGPEVAFVLSSDDSGWGVEEADGRGPVYVNGVALEGASSKLFDGDHVEVGFHDLVLAGSGEPRPGTTALNPADGQILVGREESCDLVLSSPAIDRRHARISTTREGLLVEDLNSKGGTRVNGDRITRRLLKAGDRVGVGNYRIVYDGERLLCPGTSTPMRVEARSVSFEVPGKVLLDRVSVTLEPGTLTAIIGESGSGKSTLMKALSGHQPPTSGVATLNGEPLTGTRPEMAMVPQSDLVHGELTVGEALVDAAALRLPPDSTPQELGEVAGKVGLELGIAEAAASGTPFRDLSGGQQKRVSVGVELVNEPGVLFLDEPTTGLDPGKEATVMEKLRDLTDAGRTVALVTHATASLHLCDSLVVIGAGGLLCFRGSPAGALEFFGVATYGEIYSVLEKRAPEWAEAFAAIAEPLEQGVALPAPITRRFPRLRDYARDFKVLIRRQWRLLLRDRKNLLIVLGQAPALGVLSGLLIKGQAFAPDAPPTEAVQLLFVLVMISLWLGSIGSCRELVKEKSIVARERAAGVSTVPYMAAKLIFLFVLCCLQVAVLLAVTFAFQPLDQPLGNWLMLAVVFAAVSLAAVTLGLAISAVSGTESQAVSIVPLALIPQLLFGGSLVPPSQMSFGVEALSRLAASQWGLRGAGSAIDLQTRFEGFPPTPATAGLATGFFDIALVVAVGVLVAIALVQLAVMAAGLRRR